MKDEQEIEQAVQAAGNTAPRVTPEHVDACIVSAHYFTAEDGVVGETNGRGGFLEIPDPLSLLTFCVLVLRNGFTVTGESACASPENFDPSIGRKIAYDNARNKIWMLEGYLLKERIATDAL